MNSALTNTASTRRHVSIAERYQRIRQTSLDICQDLEVEDFVIQSMADVSPTKWHLAHTTWFFERFLLQESVPDYRCYDETFRYLFNSYYYTAGEMHARPMRGLLSRPTVAEIYAFRAHVDECVLQALPAIERNSRLAEILELGLNHEQQHQELILSDIKHVFSLNPLRPAASLRLKASAESQPAPHRFIAGQAGLREIGAQGGGFCFDNETPRHRTLVNPHSIGSRLITCGEYREFIRAGGYEKSELWLSDGWAAVRERGWNRPLYWAEDLESEFTLGGQRDIDDGAPVAHVSYYEADAYARWFGARLPTEAEWELAASQVAPQGNLMDAGYWHPIAGGDSAQFFGDVWEWTSSSYAAYPGFRPLAGSLGEYNGKFMCNQMTVRGGSCVTADDHIRASYRSFFYPDARWQFLGIRLARDEAGGH
ncbi:MAG: ergothioneine biosynthesis protein EgtB [Gammaproteobacteria bacterium]|nr:ergothioneine biosynthesis protein EgtB [Gammaproteobacteria bacterium]